MSEPHVPADDDRLPPLRKADVATPSIIFATIAVLALALGITVAAVAGDDDTASTVGAPLSAHVSLTEFALDPDSLEVAQGGTVHVQNDGSVAHNLAIEGTDLATPDLAGGEAAELDVSSLAPGTYQVLCLISGHADAGMRGELEVVAGGGSGDATPTSTADHQGHTMDYAKMTADMLATMTAYPAETAGVGNVPLEPTEVLADGTKVFDLDMRLEDWEVEPGKVVEAWTFNGMVPGPRIDLEVGDTAHFRVTNNLPIATDVHLHGLNVENRFDGVAPYTQDLIEPGDTFTYEYVADEVAVAMYHPHAHGHKLLPDGMFGTILVGDMPLPAGRSIGAGNEVVPPDVQVSQEFPMVLNDSGVIGYSLNGKSFPATAPVTANVGDWILVHYYNEGTQIHPMHLHQFDQIVVSKDGYVLDQPYLADTLNVAPGERYSVLVHVDKPGTWVWHCHILPHVERESGMFGMVTALIAE